MFDRCAVGDFGLAFAAEASEEVGADRVVEVVAVEGQRVDQVECDLWPVEPTCWQDLSQPPLQK